MNASQIILINLGSNNIMLITEYDIKLQEEVEDTIIFIFLTENLNAVSLEVFYEIFIEYCHTDLSIFYIRCYLLNLVCRDILECRKGVFKFKRNKRKPSRKK